MKIVVASTFFQRCLGLIPKQFQRGGLSAALLEPSSLQSSALFFPRCQSLHTIGMLRHVDIAFIDAQSCVIKSCRAVPPLRIVSCAGADAALERFSKDSRWPQEGETVVLEEVKTVKADEVERSKKAMKTGLKEGLGRGGGNACGTLINTKGGSYGEPPKDMRRNSS